MRVRLCEWNSVYGVETSKRLMVMPMVSDFNRKERSNENASKSPLKQPNTDRSKMQRMWVCVCANVIFEEDCDIRSNLKKPCGEPLNEA